MPTQTAAPSWTWQEPPPSRAPIRVPSTSARWRVGRPAPGPGDLLIEEAAVRGLDISVTPGIPGDFAHDDTVRRFLDILDRDGLAPHRGVHLRARGAAQFGETVLTAWAYVLPTHHPIQDPHPVDPADTSTDLHEWAYTAARTVLDADRDRRTADPSAPPVEWAFRAHPATIRDLMERDRATERAYNEALSRTEPGALRSSPPRPILDPLWYTPDGGSGWTIHGHRLDTTTKVEPGFLHAHQVLPVDGRRHALTILFGLGFLTAVTARLAGCAGPTGPQDPGAPPPAWPPVAQHAPPVDEHPNG